MIKILHIITNLATGGAEVMLYKLLSRLDRRVFAPTVLSLKDKGIWGEPLENLGIPVHAVHINRGCSALAALWRLWRCPRWLSPDLIQGWMYHGNLAASLASLASSRNVPVIWNIRHAVYRLGYEKRLTAALIRVGGLFSRTTARIIYNSKVSARQHESLGYRETLTEIIPNGFDCSEFHPRVGAGAAWRRHLHTGEDAILIGLIGRYHPMKDHANFMQAAGMLAPRKGKVHFVLAGRGVEPGNPVIADLCRQYGLAGRIHLLGERTDMPEITAALDIACCTSYSESFPNVVGEAMACGVPCVVTDVGDAAWVLGGGGIVVPPRDPAALAQAWERLIEAGGEERLRMGQVARARILQHFALDQVVRQYEALYKKVIGEARQKPRKAACSMKRLLPL